MAETSKARPHRLRDGWFDKYVKDPTIDIGCGKDPLSWTCRRWDYECGDGDATRMAGVPDGTYSTCYASHLLEHLEFVAIALENWWRILKPGGNLIVLVPHRDLYEKRSQPPSIYNGDHKWFFLPESEEPPRTLNFKKLLQDTLPNADFLSFEVLKEGWRDVGPDLHSPGEYSIEAILRKLL